MSYVGVVVLLWSKHVSIVFKQLKKTVSIHIYTCICVKVSEQKLRFKFTPILRAVVCDCPQWSVQRVWGVGLGSHIGHTVSRHPVQRTHHRDFPFTRPAGHHRLTATHFFRRAASAEQQRRIMETAKGDVEHKGTSAKLATLHSTSKWVKIVLHVNE